MRNSKKEEQRDLYRVHLSTPQIAIIAASLVYLVLFISILIVGGLDQATAFLQGSRDGIASLLHGTRDAITILLSASRDSFTTVIAAVLHETVDAYVTIIHATGVEWFLVLFVLTHVVVSLGLGLYFDHKLTLAVVLNICEALQNAIATAWQTISNPKVVLAYGFFIVMVSFFTLVPDALRMALITS
jgi:hypothetical protein